MSRYVKRLVEICFEKGYSQANTLAFIFCHVCVSELPKTKAKEALEAYIEQYYNQRNSNR